jgi:hypothetical protein
VPLAIYMDVHVPLGITDALRRRGIDVLTSQDDRTTLVDDEELLTRASDLGRLIVTQDGDFLGIAASWSKSGRSFGGIFYAHQLGVSIGQLVEDIELITSCCELNELVDRVTFLPLRWAL